MVRNDNMLVYIRDRVNIVQQASQDSVVTYLQERLREVLGQFSQARSVSCSYYYIFHSSTNRAPSVECTQ